MYIPISVPQQALWEKISDLTVTGNPYVRWLLLAAEGCPRPGTGDPNGGAVNVHIQAAADWWRGVAASGWRIPLHGNGR